MICEQCGRDHCEAVITSETPDATEVRCYATTDHGGRHWGYVTPLEERFGRPQGGVVYVGTKLLVRGTAYPNEFTEHAKPLLRIEGYDVVLEWGP